MANVSGNVKELASNLLALIFIIALDCCFFWEDDAEEVSQSYIEAALDGEGEDMAELSTKFMPYLGRMSFKIDHPRQRDMWDGLMKETDIDKLNASMELAQQKLAHRLARRAKRHEGWDEVEVLGVGIKELPSAEQSIWAWLSSWFEDRPWSWIIGFLEEEPDEPQYREDKVGLAIAKITYDDGSLDYEVLALTHVDNSEYTIEGWSVTQILRTISVDAGYDEDDIKSLEEKLQELLKKFGQEV